MVGIVIISHGNLASGLLDAVRMIGGEQQQLEVVSLREEQTPEQHAQEVAEAVAAVGDEDGVLILVDLFGATPFNVSGKIAMSQDQIEVVTGVNLPMALEVCLRRNGASLAELVTIAKEGGQSGVRVLSESLDS